MTAQDEKNPPNKGREENRPIFLSAQNVADRYGLTRKWVYGCKQLQDISIKVGRYRLYKLEDIEAFEQRRTTPASGFQLLLMRREHQSVVPFDKTEKEPTILRNNKLGQGKK